MYNKEKNDAIYKHLMESRKRDPKRYAYSSIAVAYEEVRNYAHHKNCNREELKYLVQRFSMRLREIAERFGLSGAEVKEYFARNNYSMVF